MLIGQSAVDWIWLIPGLTAIGIFALSVARRAGGRRGCRRPSRGRIASRRASPRARARVLPAALRLAGRGLAVVALLAPVVACSRCSSPTPTSSARGRSIGDPARGAVRRPDGRGASTLVGDAALSRGLGRTRSMGDRAAAYAAAATTPCRSSRRTRPTLGVLGDFEARGEQLRRCPQLLPPRAGAQSARHSACSSSRGSAQRRRAARARARSPAAQLRAPRPAPPGRAPNVASAWRRPAAPERAAQLRVRVQPRGSPAASAGRDRRARRPARRRRLDEAGGLAARREHQRPSGRHRLEHLRRQRPGEDRQVAQQHGAGVARRRTARGSARRRTAPSISTLLAARSRISAPDPRRRRRRRRRSSSARPRARPAATPRPARRVRGRARPCRRTAPAAGRRSSRRAGGRWIEPVEVDDRPQRDATSPPASGTPAERRRRSPPSARRSGRRGGRPSARAPPPRRSPGVAQRPELDRARRPAVGDVDDVGGSLDAPRRRRAGGGGEQRRRLGDDDVDGPAERAVAGARERERGVVGSRGAKPRLAAG